MQLRKSPSDPRRRLEAATNQVNAALSFGDTLFLLGEHAPKNQGMPDTLSGDFEFS